METLIDALVVGIRLFIAFAFQSIWHYLLIGAIIALCWTAYRAWGEPVLDKETRATLAGDFLASGLLWPLFAPIALLYGFLFWALSEPEPASLQKPVPFH